MKLTTWATQGRIYKDFESKGQLLFHNQLLHVHADGWRNNVIPPWNELLLLRYKHRRVAGAPVTISFGFVREASFLFGAEM